MRISIEKRRTSQPLTVVLVAVGSILLSLAIAAGILRLSGYPALSVLGSSFKYAYLTKYGFLSSLVYIAPISLCALSVVIAAKAGLWNIGVEGQFLIGAIVAAGLGIFCPNLPKPVLIPLMFVMGAAAAGMVCYISVIPRMRFGISEILTTVLLNNIISYFMRYLIYDRWDDPATYAAQTMEIGPNAVIGKMIQGYNAHWGFIAAILIIFLMAWLLKKSILGYEIRAVGETPESARYAGINIKKFFFISMFLSGCLAGAAGMLEVSGVVYRLQTGIASDYGLSSFVIAWVARLKPMVILFVSYLFAGLTVASFTMQMSGLPYAVVQVIKGLILFFILAGELLTYYKISFNNKKAEILPELEKAEIAKTQTEGGSAV